MEMQKNAEANTTAVDPSGQPLESANHRIPAKSWVLPVVTLILLACVAYANSFRVPFAYDDLESIQTNEVIRTGAYLHSADYYLRIRSLTYASLAFNYWLGGLRVAGYHVVNLLLHVLNGLLVFAIAVRIFSRLKEDPTQVRIYAWLSAALFLVHPVQTESVTYISSRSELLAGFFFLLGVLFFVLLPEKKIGFFASIPVALCLVLGLGGKEEVIVLPAVILLYDWLFLAQASWRSLITRFSRWRFYLPFITAVVFGVNYLITRRILVIKLALGANQNYPPWNYLISQPRAIARYLRLLILPTGLNLDYDFQAYVSLLQLPVLMPLLLIASLTVAAFFWRKRRPIFTFGILWFFVTLAPRSSIVPSTDLAVEHRLYLPMAGLCFAFPFIVEWIVSLWKIATGRHSRPTLVFASIVLVILTTLTLLRNEVWADEVRLWTDVVAKSPHKLRPYNRLIYAYMQRGQFENAIPVANRGLDNVPAARVSFFDTIGNLYLKMGRPDQAVPYFEKSADEAVRNDLPGDFKAPYFNNLGMGYMALANAADERYRTIAWRRAQAAFGISIDASEKYVATMDSFVKVSHMLGDDQQLEKEYRDRFDLSPHEFRTLYSLAVLLSLKGQDREALPYFEEAEQRMIDLGRGSTLYFNYALALSKAGQSEKAIEKYLKALTADPELIEADYNLALLYIQKQDYPSAMEYLNRVLNKEPAHPRANLTLARIYAYQGKWAPAKERIEMVLKADPQNSQAVAMLRQIPAQ